MPCCMRKHHITCHDGVARSHRYKTRHPVTAICGHLYTEKCHCLRFEFNLVLRIVAGSPRPDHCQACHMFSDVIPLTP